ncbi:hypothetical protein B0H10DRAFT_1944771 [Mycena sp. CBHHK59/15]|nr:hypothetical protein B0H10DRAFT_1944771 [Mycena sp. CBHHK59/15]
MHVMPLVSLHPAIPCIFSALLGFSQMLPDLLFALWTTKTAVQVESMFRNVLVIIEYTYVRGAYEGLPSNSMGVFSAWSLYKWCQMLWYSFFKVNFGSACRCSQRKLSTVQMT